SGLLSGCGSNGAYVVPTPTAAATIDPGAATTTLQELQAVVRRGDAAAARRFGSDPAAQDLLAAVAGNVRRIGLDDVTLTYLDENGGGSFQGSWGATAQVSWRVRGFDHGVAQRDIEFTFADGGRTISRIGGGRDATPLWLSGPVIVRRSADVLVIATAPAKEADALRAAAEVGLRRDRQVLGGRHTVVFEAPATVAAMQRALGVQPPTYEDIAAITAPVDGNRLPGAPVHVFVNPLVYRRMDHVAAQVVVTHESVHAVTNAPLSSSAPLWLVEGFADYVALGDVGLPLSKTAAGISQQVRRRGAPRQLPTDADFGTADSNLGPTYEAAWLVCVTIADHAGQAALVKLYREVLGGAPLATALPRDTGLTVASLTAAWRSELTAVAAVAR
ncbi:MAG TPA: hypothetical protein VN088_01670, partial [Nocardioides sp.]|nr:hypothetical protein [Nocardioides sp.]